jgi:hypothetical protein
MKKSDLPAGKCTTRSITNEEYICNITIPSGPAGRSAMPRLPSPVLAILYENLGLRVRRTRNHLHSMGCPPKGGAERHGMTQVTHKAALRVNGDEGAEGGRSLFRR